MHVEGVFMYRVAVALLLVVFTSAALAQPAKRRSQPAAPAGPSVCVASAIGHTFHVQKIGFMAFGNALDVVPIDSWGIDDFVVRRIGAMVGKRATVRRIRLPPAMLAAYEKPGGLFRDLDRELREAVQAAAAGAARVQFLRRGQQSVQSL
jgi:hypothetical protein